jgi:hypothetical protein
MPTYRFPAAVKAADIPFSKGRDYKPCIGIDRIVAKDNVKVKTANNITQLLGASGAMSMSRASLATSASVPMLVLPTWNRNFKDHIDPTASSTILEHRKKVKTTNMKPRYKGPLGNSGVKWIPSVPHERPGPEFNRTEKSLQHALKQKALQRATSHGSLQIKDAPTIPEYVAAKDIDNFFQAKKEVQRLRRILSRNIIENQRSHERKMVRKKHDRLEWKDITSGTAAKTGHAFYN